VFWKVKIHNVHDENSQRCKKAGNETTSRRCMDGQNIGALPACWILVVLAAWKINLIKLLSWSLAIQLDNNIYIFFWLIRVRIPRLSVSVPILHLHREDLQNAWLNWVAWLFKHSKSHPNSVKRQNANHEIQDVGLLFIFLMFFRGIFNLKKHSIDIILWFLYFDIKSKEKIF
jgi:hypothetical protein